jgi:hypothetical protein
MRQEATVTMHLPNIAKVLAAPILFVLVFVSGPPAHAATAQIDPPTDTLVILYHCAPSARPLQRHEATTILAPRFEHWKRNGLIKGYRLLFSSYVNAKSWDMLAIVRLGSFRGIARWRAVERKFPGGLDSAMLRIASPTNEFIMDTIQSKRTPQGERHAGVFLVIPYTFSPTPYDEYVTYARQYVLPETNGWLKRGNITGYGLYVNHFYPDSPVQALLVIEYRNVDALAHRAKVVEATREALSHDPSWTSWSHKKAKGHMRNEGQSVIAEQLAGG